MTEFDKLMKIHNKYLEYEHSKLKLDTPQNIAIVYRGFKQLLDKINALWTIMPDHEQARYIKLLHESR